MTPGFRSIALLALVCSAQALTARELYWRELDVTAKLDERGALQISERHAMVFTGDWNGGERTFNLEHGETISIQTITRIDQPGGTPIQMQEGGLDAVDHWAWVNPTTIRWRSRTPGSPAFNNTPIDYIIEYTETNVLRTSLTGNSYTLKHDFTFPQRDGEIRIFRLHFDLDSSWRAVEGGPVNITTGPLPPGRSFIVNVTVVNAVGDAAAPGLAAVLSDRTDVLGRALMAALALLGVAILWLRFLKLERNNGRYVPIATEDVTWSWLDAHSKDLLPEVAAAIDSGKVEDSAVAATLARLTAEGRIASWTTEKDVLHLELRQPIENFTSYERKLMDEVFFGRVTTDTRAIREHYRTFGFKPSLTIKSGVNERIKDLIQEDRPRSGNFGVIAFGAFVAAVIAFIWMVRTTSEISATAVTVMVGASIAGAVVLYRAAAAGQIEAHVWRDMDSAPGSTRAFMLAPALGIVLTILVAIFAPAGATGIAFTGVFTCLALSAAGIVLQGGNSLAGPRRRLWENQIRKLRYFLSDEAHRRTPIDDRYVPYLVAFGLEQRPTMTVVAPSSPVITTRQDPHTWSGDQPSSHAVRAAAPDPSAVPAAPAPAYAAGDGAFGGAGASGSWAAAASSLAAGVDRPVSSSGRGSDWKSSSSDHSTSSNDNSRSGGGGGGGW